ncbi:MAG: glutathione S-transferase family protein [Rhizobiaceae bacterium]|nr:glutathione S-transferase family protein [Rhizobiaceae bacterium]
MYTLIGSPKTRSFRVLWMLEELGLEYQVEAVGPRTPEILALNPSGKLPVLKDGDDAIIDSTAIIQYLADKHNKLTFAAGTIERAKQDSFTCFALDDLDGILWGAAKHSFVLPEELRSDAVKPASQFDFAKSLITLEKRLGDNKYVMGDVFTVPDIIITHCAGWAANAKFDWPEGPLSDYVDRVRKRPAYIRANEVRSAS